MVDLGGKRYVDKAPFTINFDWVDYISNVGYKKFYGVAAKGDAPVYTLTPRALDSSTGDGVGATYTSALGHDMDFDIEFKKEATVGPGKAFINITAGGLDNGAKTHTITANVKHVTALGAETSIGTTADETLTPGVDNQNARQLIIVDITEKQFKVGEILRLTITSAGNNSFLIYHDSGPAGLTLTDIRTRTISTDLIFECPFKLVE